MNLKDFIYSQKIEKTHTVTRIFGIKFKIRNGRWEMKIKRKEKPYDIGILSVNINSRICNFGAAIHSFAFQQYLDKKNVSNVIINYYPESIKSMFVTSQCLQCIKKGDIKNLLKNLYYGYFIFLKKVKFLRFFKKYCNITKHRYEIDTLSQIKSINRFIVETDVTWMKYKTGFDRGFFCDLPNMKNKDNVAYSVDFGSKEFSEKDVKLLQKYVQNFKNISIRNIFKLDYFRNITNKQNICITVDPVFLLNKDDYLKVISKPKLKEEYVFVFNCVENDPEMVKMASNYAKDHNLKLVVVNSFVNNIIDWKQSYPTPIGVESFLGLLNGCKYFFTNSYHGICLAIIFQKSFCAFERKGNSDKILTILNLFDLEDRLFKSKDIPQNNINYQKVNKKWLELRQEAEIFLKDANVIKG